MRTPTRPARHLTRPRRATLASVALALASLALASLVLGGCAVSANPSSSGDDVVERTRQLVTTVDAAGAGSDQLPVLEREVSGPTECLEGDGYQGSLAWTLVLEEDADVDTVLGDVQERWESLGVEVERTDDDPRLPRVQGEGPGGASYTAEVVRETMTLHYLATTPCAPLPDDAEVTELRGRFAAEVDPDGEQVLQDVSRSLADQVAELRAGG